MRTTIFATAAVLTLAGCGAVTSGGQQQSPRTQDSPVVAVSSPAPPTSSRPPSAATIAAAMRAAGLNLGQVTVWTASTDPNQLLGRPGGYTSKVEWSKGGIEVYPDVAGAARRLRYLKGLAGTVLGDGYDYLAGTAILRLARTMTPSQARVWRAAFERAAP